jgi:hypothetical protein
VAALRIPETEGIGGFRAEEKGIGNRWPPIGKFPSGWYCSPMEAIKYAYSTFPELLEKLRLTVAEAHQRLVARGFKFDKKTLYRLASHEPIQTISAPLVGAVCAEFKVGVEDLLVWRPPTPKLHRIDEKTQARLDVLMAKNNEGTITVPERKELTLLGDRVEQLSLDNAKMLSRHAELRKRERSARRTAIARSGRKAA